MRPTQRSSVKLAAQFFKVLADEARLRMLWLLFNHEELCVCDFMTALEITQSKASRHLSTLRHAKLVTDRKEGLWSYYALCPCDDALEREHLALLRETLAKRADAKPLLTKLHKWLNAKDRGATCTTGGACEGARSGPSKARTATRRTSRKGGSR
jgi:ArsR family transcriptional regulator